MAAFKAGDRVKIVNREVNIEDTKTGLYYAYFGDLTGKVDRVYDDGSVCVDIDIDALSRDAQERHFAIQEIEQKRWLENLSGEVRSRLTEEQRKLKMSYKILVNIKDVEPYKGDKPKGGKEKASTNSDATAENEKGADTAPNKQQSDAAEATAKRLSESDLAAAEEEYLKSLKKDS